MNPSQIGKIINDPVNGFIRIKHPLVQAIIDHPYFQRLRRIKQMGSADLVYPGATHSRFHHSLGTYRLMGIALQELQFKGVEITQEEILQASIAILLHDIGHGPFSHALEKTIIPKVSHEKISIGLMHLLNEEFNGALDMAIAIFQEEYHERPWIHALISSQLDMDRMDYLNRDSYYTGVSEGVIGYDRILHMLTVVDDQLMVEEKGIQSVEKFLIARRMMYWQVYQHKTVLAAELLIQKIVQRVQELLQIGKQVTVLNPLAQFLHPDFNKIDLSENIPSDILKAFCQLDDYDILGHIKVWVADEDEILSLLCERFLNREIYKISFEKKDFGHLESDSLSFHNNLITNKKDEKYFCFKGVTSNQLYHLESDAILFHSKNGEIKKLDEYDHSLIHSQSRLFLEKQYIAYFPKLERK